MELITPSLLSIINHNKQCKMGYPWQVYPVFQKQNRPDKVNMALSKSTASWRVVLGKMTTNSLSVAL